MATIADIVSSLDITESQVKSICRFLFKHDKVETLTVGESLVVLVCDFLRQTGLTFEEYVNIGHQFNENLVEHGLDLEACLREFVAGNEAVMPWCFMTMIDNRYVGLQRSDTDDTTELYDLKDEVCVSRTSAPPMFTVTVAVDALYMRTLAASDGHEKAAECFNKGLLVGKCSLENSGDN